MADLTTTIIAAMCLTGPLQDRVTESFMMWEDNGETVYYSVELGKGIPLEAEGDGHPLVVFTEAGYGAMVSYHFIDSDDVSRVERRMTRPGMDEADSKLGSCTYTFVDKENKQ